MHLLEQDVYGLLKIVEFERHIPCYAILSHRWLARNDEPTYQDLLNGAGVRKPGYNKLRLCASLAARDGLRYFWVDTVCIDKTSSSELTEAINSMFHWYSQAARCYVYLSDVTTFDSDFPKSSWFTRGWTLQELIAPRVVQFFDSRGNELGDKISLDVAIESITGIPTAVLRGTPLSYFSIKERLSWAEKRTTLRPEDKAYCLLGIFDVFMPIIYGEGTRAFRRLIEEVEKMNQETSKTSKEFEKFFKSEVSPPPIKDSKPEYSQAQSHSYSKGPTAAEFYGIKDSKPEHSQAQSRSYSKGPRTITTAEFYGIREPEGRYSGLEKTRHVRPEIPRPR